MNPEPTSKPEPNEPFSPSSPFSFDQETPTKTTAPETAVEPSPVPATAATPAYHATAPVQQPPIAKKNLGRTSGIAMYMVGVAAGLVTISGTSYLISTVLHYFIVEKSDSMMFFDLSSIDLYFLVTTIVFGLAYFAAMASVQKGSSNVALGFRRRHEIVGAVWQTLLALAIIGSFITFVYAPLNLQLNGTVGDKKADPELMSTLLSAGVIMLLSIAMLWRDRLLAKGLNGLVPTIISLLFIGGTVAATIVMLSQPEPKPKTPDYGNLMNTYDSSSTTPSSDFSAGSSSSDTSSTEWNFDSTTEAR